MSVSKKEIIDLRRKILERINKSTKKERSDLSKKIQSSNADNRS